MFSSPPTHSSRGKFNIALGGGHVSLTTELGQSSLLTSLKSPVQTVDDLDTKRERPLNNSDNNFQTGIIWVSCGLRIGISTNRIKTDVRISMMFTVKLQRYRNRNLLELGIRVSLFTYVLKYDKYPNKRV